MNNNPYVNSDKKSNNDNNFCIIVEKNPNSLNNPNDDKLSVLIKIGNKLNEIKINIVNNIDYYSNIIKRTTLDLHIRRKCISDINDFNTINKYLHQIQILLENTYNEIDYGTISEDVFINKVLYINSTLSNCQSHFEFCIKKIELTINSNSINVLNDNIYSFYRDTTFINTDQLYYILYPYLTLKYKCVFGNLMVKIDKMGDIILGPKDMFYFIHIIHTDIYRVIDNLSVGKELSYIFNNHILDTQILKFNSIIDYDDLINTKLNFTPTKKINTLLKQALNFSPNNNFNEFIPIFKSLLFECRLSTINILNNKDSSLNKINTDTDIDINNVLPCIVNNYVHHCVFSDNLVKLKEKLINIIDEEVIDFSKLERIGYQGLSKYISTKCKINILPNELFFIPISFAKHLDSIFFHNIFSLWDFIWKLAVHQLVIISKHPEKLDADIYMYLKIYLFGSAKVKSIYYLTSMMENSLLSQEDIIKYKLNKIPSGFTNYFNNTFSDNADNLILYSNNVCTLSNVETILMSFKNIIENHNQIN
jgi:hypothetical protein